MDWYIILLFISILKNGICFENNKPNVAIVGGGIGGASSSHFLTELFKNNLNIDLYEANTIGGRLATVQINNNEFEAGGSIIHSENKYMQEFVKLLGLKHKLSHDKRNGIWNGDKVVYEESEWKILSLAKFIYRYGIEPFKLKRYITSIRKNFEKIYGLQDAGKSFTNITNFLYAINAEYPKSLQISIKDQLLNLGYSEKLIDELVQTSLVVNYGQNTNIHSFVGFISLSAADGNLWSVKGGNKKVPQHLIYRNKHVNVVSSRVVKIVNIETNNTQNLYEVHYCNQDSTIVMKSTYNIVIVAVPLTSDQEFLITFEGFPNNDFYNMEKYHETVATFVQADLKPHYFGLEEELSSILSCNPNKTIVNSVGRLDSVEDVIEDKVWKIFSNKPLKPTIIKDMFSNVQEIKQIIWKAYPEYSTRIQEAKFKLHNALYHVNAIEWIASAMEMSSISGRNVALLAYKDFLNAVI
ncbi:PREDICTED: prenylcysteine oxidase 1-like [Habropoda laboriosa]|uniref:prenylcysteine oxidase 1-like n=1 Tax=Habropoda laboriosa TaxID=597456 RepID=UPI00083D863D|nr:PREDICTED: prenylcysteine oxidase 1-like [Habropoda laboriosa]